MKKSTKTKTRKHKKPGRLSSIIRKKPALRSAHVKRVFRAVRLRKPEAEDRMHEAIESLPRITNETVAEHREQLLRGARKYIYPLEHNRHRIIVISIWILSAAVIAFFTYTGLALYKFQSTSTFVYYITLAFPFPVAKAGSSFVSYENYLFELRHYTHYYQTQQGVNFSSEAGKQQLTAFKKQALQQVIDDAYIKQLASKYHVSVSGPEVDNEVQLVRQQNRLGSSNQEFAEVLKQFWGWSINDFKRELKAQLLAQKVVAKLDSGTYQRAQNAKSELQKGGDFAKIAKQYSDDSATAVNGGAYPNVIDSTNQDLPPQVLNILLQLKPGQTSGIINTGYSLEIDKVLSNNGGKIRAAHIVFNFENINNFIGPLRTKEQPSTFIHIHK
jgi:SurA-like N-terminal domain/PPIC-type PPIASE domain